MSLLANVAAGAVMTSMGPFGGCGTIRRGGLAAPLRWCLWGKEDPSWCLLRSSIDVGKGER
eukprot:12287768-Prorocentrum_lima.AAC.1